MECPIVNKVWYVETRPLDEKYAEYPSIQGGGLCIHPSGLILTSAHLVTHPSLEQKDCLIEARAYEDVDVDYYRLELIASSPQFDLALCKVSNAENKVFDFLPIGEGVKVFPGGEMFGYVHEENLLYSRRSGYANYEFPEDAFLPDLSDRTTMISSGMLGKKRPPILEKYRTVATFTRNSDVGLLHLHPNLPLVQVSGFADELSEDMCVGRLFYSPGCPLFKDGSGELVGLLTIQKDGFQFAIPVNLLKKFVDHVKPDGY